MALLKREIAALVAERALLLREMEQRYDPDQPRIPAGSSTGGQWVGDGGRDPAHRLRPVSFRPGEEAERRPVEMMRPRPGGILRPFGRPGVGPSRDVLGALNAYAAASALNGPGRQAVLEYRARGFAPLESGDWVATARVLSEEEVRDVCTRFEKAQELLDDAVRDIRREQPNLSPQQFGTAVHKRVTDGISALDDANFVAERSVIKEMGARTPPGAPGSVRVDGIQNVGNGTVCIYDFKTGDRGLYLPRMTELAINASRYYRGTTNIIVTEVKPR